MHDGESNLTGDSGKWVYSICSKIHIFRFFEEVLFWVKGFWVKLGSNIRISFDFFSSMGLSFFISARRLFLQSTSEGKISEQTLYICFPRLCLFDFEDLLFFITLECRGRLQPRIQWQHISKLDRAIPKTPYDMYWLHFVEKLDLVSGDQINLTPWPKVA
jgi:hypothetical protein